MGNYHGPLTGACSVNVIAVFIDSGVIHCFIMLWHIFDLSMRMEMRSNHFKAILDAAARTLYNDGRKDKAEDGSEEKVESLIYLSSSS